jgi:hypothetical protein
VRLRVGDLRRTRLTLGKQRDASLGTVVVNGKLIVAGGAAIYGKDYLYNDLTFVW